MKVLIVDDAKDARMVGRYMLKPYNVDIIEAINGVEAWSIIVREKPDAILLDLDMPQMDGFEVMEELYKEEYAIPVLIMTSHASLETQSLCNSMGAQAFFSKPINHKLFQQAFQQIALSN